MQQEGRRNKGGRGKIVATIRNGPGDDGSDADSKCRLRNDEKDCDFAVKSCGPGANRHAGM